jgi:hypothetical protein
MARAPRQRRSRLPRLAREIVANEDQLSIATDQVLQHDADLRRRSRAILIAQRALRSSIDEEGWARYLELEALINARFELASNVVARWAFAEGGRSRR